MRKLLQVVICGLAAASFSVLAADTEKSTGSKANSAGNAGAGASADVKTNKPAKRTVKKDKHNKQAGAGGTKAEAAPAPAPTPAQTDKK